MIITSVILDLVRHMHADAGLMQDLTWSPVADQIYKINCMLDAVLICLHS
jgi:hypothetical protein